ncbi:MAG: alpha/beta hydrolase [Anaerolineae bacterium]|nr:alpha/beta hydrolase [Anaerolineae bacterium]
MKTWPLWQRIVIPLLIVLAVAVVGFFVWANTPLAPTAEALAALENDRAMQVSESNGWIVFTPTTAAPVTGFIFYPGGRVDPRAYAPQVRAIADQGYLAVIVPMPLNLAVFGIDSAQRVIDAYPDIQHWAIGGHSLGGSMAARFVQSHPDSVQGLVFWASYPDIDLSGANIEAVSIYGTSDAVAQRGTITDSAARLPAGTPFVAIDGGNHSQFGAYGLQPGDNVASASAADQLSQTVEATISLLTAISE